MFNPNEIIGLIADNLRKTRNPFGVPNSWINTWWKDVPVRGEGESMLFTGLMYQSAPYIEQTTRQLERIENTFLARYIRFGKYVPKFLTGTGMALMAPRKEKKQFNAMLGNITRALYSSGADFYYKPKLDYYSGVLLYDLGDEKGFAQHARFVAGLLQSKGVKKLITVDPHTTYAMKELYPKYTGVSFEVKSYLELIDPSHMGRASGEQSSGKLTLHDPCFYGRYLQVSDTPKKILDQMGVNYSTVRRSGPFTHCCGGPAESVAPGLSQEIGLKRLVELNRSGGSIVSMCPICYGNLRRLGADVVDFSTVITRASQ